MSVISIYFFIFLLVVYITIFSINRIIKDENIAIRLTKYALLLASYLFIALADYRFLIIIILLTFFVYIFQNRRQEIGVIISLCFLGVFKYLDFFIDSIYKVLNIDYQTLNIILPIGISFYTFSAISFLLDRKKDIIPKSDILDVAIYLSFFPKLTSGPLQRFDDFNSQLNKKRILSYENFSKGIQIMMIGIFKKIVLADRLSIFVNQVFNTPKVFSSITLILAVFAYSLEIYYDFFGYSDIAIGIAKILDFDLPGNFNLPYISCNVTEFWKRWHMTLSSWLHDYLYIGLGGNRKGKLRQYINLVLTMLICGIWHGSNWTFVVWGLLNGMALVIHKIYSSITKNKIKHVYYCVISQVCTFIFISFTWIYFRSTTISKANEYILRMFSFETGVNHFYMWFFIAGIFFTISIIYHFIKCDKEKYENGQCNVQHTYIELDLTTIKGLTLFFIFCGLILCFAYAGSNPFIYGNF